MNRHVFASTVVVIAGLVCAPPSHAQSWEITFTPYAWIPGLDGKLAVSPALPTAEVDIDFDDVLSDLQLGLAGTFVARSGRFSILADGLFAQTGSEAKVNGGLVNSAHVDTETFMTSLAAAYRVIDAGFSVDLLGGGRYTWTKAEITINQTTSGEGDQQWFDGFVGIVVEAPISKQWSVTGYADVGAGDSNATYQLYGGVNFYIDERWRLSAGYRHYDVDYDDGDFIYDIAQSGLQFGVSVPF